MSQSLFRPTHRSAQPPGATVGALARPVLRVAPMVAHAGGGRGWWNGAPDPALVAWQLAGGVAALVRAENTRRTQEVPNVSPGQGMFGGGL